MLIFRNGVGKIAHEKDRSATNVVEEKFAPLWTELGSRSSGSSNWSALNLNKFCPI